MMQPNTLTTGQERRRRVGRACASERRQTGQRAEGPKAQARRQMAKSAVGGCSSDIEVVVDLPPT
jgi:hypothetical protein